MLGSDFWHTTPVERLGITAIMVADGPHGLRMQPDEADHVGHRRERAGDLLPDRRRRWRRRGTATWSREVGAALGAGGAGRRASRSCSARAST